MYPLFFQINKLPLMIIPDVQIHLNGHALITYIYNIYLDCDKGNPNQKIKKELAPKTEKLHDPDYFGYIIFHKTDGIFTYVPDGENQLSQFDVEELVDMISHVKNLPDMRQRFSDN